LKQLEEEAEEEIAELQAGDQEVKEALDGLIEAHHHAADHVVDGLGSEPGPVGDAATLGAAGKKEEDVVRLARQDTGAPASLPVLTLDPPRQFLRMQPGETRALIIRTRPSTAWPSVIGFSYSTDPKLDELRIAEDRLQSGIRLSVSFVPGKSEHA